MLSHAQPTGYLLGCQPRLSQFDPGSRDQLLKMLQLQAHVTPNLIVEAALQHGGIISQFEMVEPSLTDIFIKLVGTPALPTASAALSARAESDN